MGDCSLIRFFKMLKKLEIIPKLAGCRASASPRSARTRIVTFRPFRAAGRRSDSSWSTRMLWTAEAVEDLKKLALEGKSASHISAALGVGSRNAVIGKASRIGIKLSGGGSASVRGKGPPRAARIQWAPAHTTRPNGDAQRSGAAAARDLQVLPADGRAPGRSFGVAEIGEMRRLRLEDIRDSACRWPLGDPRSGDFAYCGLTPVGGQSYCAGHCQMAYRSPQPRPIAREQRGLRAIASSWRLS
jgi:GcrA cell cycle regulator